MTCAKTFCQLFWIHLNCCWGGCKLPIFATWVVNQKCKFSTHRHQAAQDVCAWNWAWIPCIEEEQERLKRYTDCITFGSHNLKAFIEVLTEELDDHGFVIIARQHVAINFQEVQLFEANAVTLTVLIEGGSVAKTIPGLNFHYCRSKCCRVGPSNRFKCTKGAHATASDKLNIRIF